MKHKKKLLPVWLLVIIDILVIAAYTLGFYGLFYLTPRQLESTSIKTNIAETAAASSETEADSDAEIEADTETDENTNTDTETDTTTTEDLAAKFAEHFTDTVVSTSTSYSSENISVTLKKHTEGSGDNIITYYVADIYVADITCLQSGFADDTYGVGYTQDLLDMDESLNAILAMNGDFYGNGGNSVVIRNGEVYRTSDGDSDVCVLYYDGTMKTYTAQEFDVDQAIEDGAWQAWCFGPALLDDSGNSLTSFTTEGRLKSENPRSAVGYYEPGHYCFVVVDGRQSGYSVGMTLTQLSELFDELGCDTAYNMDGGKSSSMTYDDALVNQPTDGGREVSDCIVIKEVE